MNNKNIDCSIKGKYSVGFYEGKYEYIDDKNDWTIEGAIVAIADEIAQRHHDVEVAIIAEIIDIIELFLDDNDNKTIDEIISDYSNKKKMSIVLSKLSKFIVNFYCTTYYKQLEEKMDEIATKFNLISSNIFNKKKCQVYSYIIDELKNESLNEYFGFEFKKDDIDFKFCDKKFQDYLFGTILHSELAQSMDGKSDFIIRKLFKAYFSNPKQLPDNTVYRAYCNLESNYDSEIPLYEARKKF